MEGYKNIWCQYGNKTLNEKVLIKRNPAFNMNIAKQIRTYLNLVDSGHRLRYRICTMGMFALLLTTDPHIYCGTCGRKAAREVCQIRGTHQGR